MEFARKWALITGASAGIGKDFAHLLAGEGANLFLTARRQSALEELKKTLEGRFDIKVEYLPTDLSQAANVDFLKDEIKNRGISIDLLINNAGFGIYDEFVESDWDQTQKMLNLNIVSLTQLTHAFLQEMKEKNAGSILQVASVAAYQPTPQFAAYGASKAYVLNFSEALNFELRNSNINVTTLCPGATATEFFDVAEMAPPKGIMTSQEVAKAGLEGLRNKQAVVVPGVVNKISTKTVSWIPRSLQLAAANYVVSSGESN